jgi:hypothetical protein
MKAKVTLQTVICNLECDGRLHVVHIPMAVPLGIFEFDLGTLATNAVFQQLLASAAMPPPAAAQPDAQPVVARQHKPPGKPVDLSDVVKALTPTDRKMLAWLKKGYSYNQIARMDHCKPVTAYQRINKLVRLGLAENRGYSTGGRRGMYRLPENLESAVLSQLGLS